jgi:hypothetical protein
MKAQHCLISTCVVPGHGGISNLGRGGVNRFSGHATGTAARRGGSPDLTPRLDSGRSAGISDGNHDGNDGSRQQPEAAINSQLLLHV